MIIKVRDIKYWIDKHDQLSAFERVVVQGKQNEFNNLYPSTSFHHKIGI